MKFQGVVINLANGKAVVATDDFQCFFIKRRATFYVGKQIEFTKSEIIRTDSFYARLMVSAACILFIITLFLNFTGMFNITDVLSGTEVFAYIDVDINPSLEMEIDGKGKVLELVPLNDDAKVLIDKLKIDKVSVDEALEIIIDEVKKNTCKSEVEKDYVLISSTLNSKNNKNVNKYQAEKQKLNDLMNKMKFNLEAESEVEVYFVQSSIYEREAARSKGISTGRYVLYNNYKNSENSFSIEEAKKVNVKVLLKHGDDEQNAYATPSRTQNDTEVTNLKLNTPSTTPIATSKQTPGLKAELKSEATPIQTQVRIKTPIPTKTENSLFMRFESYNYSKHFIKHESCNLRISKDIEIFEDTIFRVVPGLADTNCISFESKNYPGYYLKHENYKIILKKNDGSQQFSADATFRKVPGLADTKHISFQSYNYPNRYIRHRKYYLYIEQINTDLDKKDATYIGIRVK